MPYPEDPFALTIRTAWKCPSCGNRPLIRATKDQQSPFLGQVVCQKCSYTNDVNSFRASLPIRSPKSS